MDDWNRIPMPSKEERRASIQRILDEGLPASRPGWQTLPLSVLFFGVEDCLFLSALLTGLGLACTFASARQVPADTVPALLFLLSPALYAVPHLLTLWKDAMSGTLDWKRTCRIPLRVLLALRMLFFGGAAVAVSVPACALLWLLSDCRFSLAWLLSLAFSSLFLYASLSLLRWNAGRRAVLLPPVLWAGLGLVLLWWDLGRALLLQVPAAVFFLLAGAGLAFCLRSLCAMILEPKGAVPYAVR